MHLFIYLCPILFSQSIAAIQGSPKATLFFPGSFRFLQDLPQEGHSVWAGAAAHPVPLKYSSVEDERQLPALGGKEIGKYPYKCDS